jgi:hypothetical protein
MNISEQISAWLAILLEIGLVAFFLLQPQFQILTYLLPACFIGLVANTVLLFLVFRDLWLRSFANPKTKFLWGGAIFVFWPLAIVYLLLHGRRNR